MTAQQNAVKLIHLAKRYRSRWGGPNALRWELGPCQGALGLWCLPAKYNAFSHLYPPGSMIWVLAGEPIDRSTAKLILTGLVITRAQEQNDRMNARAKPQG